MSVLKEKFGIRYYSELGIIDLFGLSLSKEELKERIEFDFHDTYGSARHSFYEEINTSDIDDMIDEIKNIIKADSGENPIIVSFFAVPDFGELGFNLCPIAKILNNGSTYVFSKDKNIFEYLNRINGFYLSIKEIE